MRSTPRLIIPILLVMICFAGSGPLFAQQTSKNEQIDFIIRVESLCSQKDLPNIFLGTIEQFQKESYLKDINVSSCNRIQSTNDNAIMTATFSFTSFTEFDKWYNSEHMKKLFNDLKTKSDQLQFRYEQKRNQ